MCYIAALFITFMLFLMTYVWAAAMPLFFSNSELNCQQTMDIMNWSIEKLPLKKHVTRLDIQKVSKKLFPKNSETRNNFLKDWQLISACKINFPKKYKISYAELLKKSLQSTDRYTTFYSDKEFKTFSKELESEDPKERIHTKVITWEDEKALLIKVPNFYGSAENFSGNFTGKHRVSQDVQQALLKKAPSVKAVVLDFRDNPGGFLEEAVELAGLFIGNKTVVQIVENHSKYILNANTTKPLYTGPLFVLVNKNSASAAEMVAAALQDYDRATVYGSKKTYGKGSVQKLFYLNDDIFLSLKYPNISGVVKVTTNYYLSPKGRSLDKKGLESDVIVKN
jgi:C-terminal processing protease CtpA/Prc